MKHEQRKLDFSWNWSPLYHERWVEAMNGIGVGKRRKNGPLELSKMATENGHSRDHTSLSPRSQRRRRREMELEARRVVKEGSSSSELSGPDEGTSSSDAQIIRKKAQSASPVDESRKKPSYRQYLRQKRSRSRDNKGGYQNEGKMIQQEVLMDDNKALSQVHWKVHRMPQMAGAFNEETNPLDWTTTPLKEQWVQPEIQDKTEVRKSWLNASQQRHKSVPERHDIPYTTPSTGRSFTGPVASSDISPVLYRLPSEMDQPSPRISSQMALLSQSVHSPLQQIQNHKYNNPSDPSYSGPKSAYMIQRQHEQQQQQQRLIITPPKLSSQPPARSSEESSPLDIVPVKERISPQKAYLKISENSAFRPIHPAAPTVIPSDARSPGAIIPQSSAHVMAFPSTKKRITVPFMGHSVPQYDGQHYERPFEEEAIYVSVKDVTSHRPPVIAQQPLPQQLPEPVVQVNPVFDHPVFQLSPQDAFAAAPISMGGSNRQISTVGAAVPLQKSQSVASVHRTGDEAPKRVSRFDRFAAQMVSPKRQQLAKTEELKVHFEDKPNIESLMSRQPKVKKSFSQAHIPESQPSRRAPPSQKSLPESFIRQSAHPFQHFHNKHIMASTPIEPIEEADISKVFVAKPPPLDESNLERWKARKKSMERKHDGSAEFMETSSAVPLVKMPQTESSRPSFRRQIALSASSLDKQDTATVTSPPAIDIEAEHLLKPDTPLSQTVKSPAQSPINAKITDEQLLEGKPVKSWIVTPQKLEATTSSESAVAAAWKKRELSEMDIRHGSDLSVTSVSHTESRSPLLTAMTCADISGSEPSNAQPAVILDKPELQMGSYQSASLSLASPIDKQKFKDEVASVDQSQATVIAIQQKRSPLPQKKQEPPLISQEISVVTVPTGSPILSPPQKVHPHRLSPGFQKTQTPSGFISPIHKTPEPQLLPVSPAVIEKYQPVSSQQQIFVDKTVTSAVSKPQTLQERPSRISLTGDSGQEKPNQRIVSPMTTEKPVERIKLTVNIPESRVSPRITSPVKQETVPSDRHSLVSPTITGPNVTSKAKLFEMVAQYEEENRQKSYFPPGFQTQEIEPAANIVRVKKPVSAQSRAHTVHFAEFDSAEPSSPAAVSNVDQNRNYHYPSGLVTKSNTGHVEPEVPKNRTVIKIEPDTANPDKSELSVTQKMKLFESQIADKKKKRRYQTQPVTQENLSSSSFETAESSSDEIAAATAYRPSERVKSQNTVVGLARPVGPKIPTQGQFQLPIFDWKSSAVTSQPRQTAKRVVHLHTIEATAEEEKQNRKSVSPIKSVVTSSHDDSSLSETVFPERKSPAAAEQRRQARQLKRMGVQHNQSGECAPDTSSQQQCSQPEVERNTTTITTSQFKETKPTTMLATESAGSSIGERLALLKKGEEQWKVKIETQHKSPDVIMRQKHTPAINGISDERRPLSIADRMSQLSERQTLWTARVPAEKDKETESLTVDGRMKNAGLRVSLTATPVIPRSNVQKFVESRRPASVAGPILSTKSVTTQHVSIPKQLDEGLDAFYSTSCTTSKSVEEVDETAFDLLTSQTPKQKLVLSKGIRPPRRTLAASKNPVKALAERPDIQSEYSEKVHEIPKFGFISKFSDASATPKRPHPPSDPMLGFGYKNPALCEEAQNALKEKVDMPNVVQSQLKPLDTSLTPGQTVQDRPYKDLMLIQLRGRKRVDLRLVEPAAKSVHSGGCFLLVTPKQLYIFAGKFANVLELAKAREVGNYVLTRGDLGCRNATEVIEIEEDKLNNNNKSQNQLAFWKLLCGDASQILDVPSDLESENRFEDIVSQANCVYSIENNALIPNDKLSGHPLHSAMLNSNEAFVFDFGVEVYAWSGRKSGPNKRLCAKLARELFEKPFHPIANIDGSKLFGPEFSLDIPRPQWSLMGEVKENLETCLFKAKFVDWPETVALPTRDITIIKPKGTSSDSDSSSPESRKKKILAFKDPSTIEISPEQLAQQLNDKKRKEPELILEEQSVGRGREVWNPSDPKMNRFEITTENATMWYVHGDGNQIPEELSGKNFGHFYTQDCYIIRWQYRVSFADVKSVTGASSKHAKNETGRTRYAYFYWIGADSSRSDQGTCALAVRDMDPNHNPHIRVTQGLEYPAFLNIFAGKMVVHKGSRRYKPNDRKWRMYAMLGGPFSTETCLTQVDPDPRVSLRPQCVYIIISPSVPSAVVAWVGADCGASLRDRARQCAQWISDQAPPGFGFQSKPNYSVCNEGQEPEQWLKEFGLRRNQFSYPKPIDYESKETIRLFKFTSTSNSQFSAIESMSSWYNANNPSHFPYEQDDLYSATQPAHCMIDQGKKLWIWEGWMDTESDAAADEATRQKLRLQRQFAVKTAVAYWNSKWGNMTGKYSVNVIYAGLEPVEFIALFPIWNRQDDAAAENKKLGRVDGQTVDLFDLLSQLSQTEYPASRLRQRPLPEGVDGSKIESYLSDSEFLELFSMSKLCFYELPAWKQLRLKKDCEIF